MFSLEFSGRRLRALLDEAINLGFVPKRAPKPNGDWDYQDKRTAVFFVVNDFIRRDLLGECKDEHQHQNS